MSLNFFSIKEWLSQQNNAAQHRCVLILAGDKCWQENSLREMLSGYQENTLWVGENESKIYSCVSAKKAHSWLGSEKQVVIFDATENFEVDAFAAISGIVVGGGLFVLLMPAEEKWNTVYSSYFGQRLIKSIQTHSEITVIKQNDEQINFTSAIAENTLPLNCVDPFLTFDQQRAVENIEAQILEDTTHPVVLISDRGRGKSAALGIAAARLVKSGIKNIAITAPRLRAADITFKHIAELLPDAEVTRGCVKYGESIIQFYPPDLLMQTHVTAEVLLVDEAAAIPVPLLTSFLHRFSQCVFATTVHGYEGTGRGFALRFNKILNEQKPGWLKLHLHTPIRWPENDFLEKWMFDLLCLDAEVIDPARPDEVELENLEHKVLKREILTSDNNLLKEVFALLVLAHYRTRPGDLKSLLDDEALSIYVTLHKKHVIAVAMVIREGNFSDLLSIQVYRGERRPQGHLLAQALTYHCGVEHAATLDYARVMRIAVHPELQQQGIGTQLLDYIVSAERIHGRDAIGVSFGMNKLLLNFWLEAGFDLVRIGFTREQTSGEHAAIMLLPLSPEGQKVNLEAQSRFIGQLPFWFNDVLKDIPDEIKILFQLDMRANNELTEFEKKDLLSFIKYSRNYELCIAALNKIVMLHPHVIAQDIFPESFRRIIHYKIVDKKSWKEIGQDMALRGQDDARKYFHQAMSYLVAKTTDLSLHNHD